MDAGLGRDPGRGCGGGTFLSQTGDQTSPGAGRWGLRGVRGGGNERWGWGRGTGNIIVVHVPVQVLITEFVGTSVTILKCVLKDLGS